MQKPMKVSPEAWEVFRKLSHKLTTKTRKVYMSDILDFTAKKLKSGEWKLDIPDE